MAMRAAIKDTNVAKLFSANFTARNSAEVMARGRYIMS